MPALIKIRFEDFVSTRDLSSSFSFSFSLSLSLSLSSFFLYFSFYSLPRGDQTPAVLKNLIKRFGKIERFSLEFL